MRLIILGLVASGLLAGCIPAGLDDGSQYYNNVTNSPGLSEEEQPLATVGDTPDAAAATEDVATGETPLDETAVDIAKTAEESANISDSQDFAATKERETIASDKAKIEARKGTYQVFEPTSVPSRKDGINLPAYALSQTNPVGQKAYSRFGTGKASCSRYRKDPDAAQRAFIRAGGPSKDPRNLDSDGDGFACNWNPDVYRKMMQNG